MRCIAIDDEPLVLDLLVDNIRQVAYLNLVEAYKNPFEAAELLQSKKIDLIFLDIQMPQLNGLQFIKALEHPPMIILVTAYQQYALEAFDFNVVDYLLKPVSFERFLKACNKAQQLYQLKNKESVADHMFVHVEYVSVKIIFADIIFVEGLKDYIKIHLTSNSRPVLTKMNLKAIEENLPSHAFKRVHKSFIVNIVKITSIKRNFVYIGEKEIPIGDVYKENVNEIKEMK
jgi:DNA-binding LytR/AlgR family response regulator